MRSKNPENPNDVIRNWLRRVDTLEFLFYWETLANKNFKPVDFDGFETRPGMNAFTISPKNGLNLQTQ